MAQQQIKGDVGTVDGDGSLTTYTVPGTSLVTPYSVSVSADGSGASGNFLPCLTFRTITGAIIARCPAPGVAAGDTAEVSWFPHVAQQSVQLGADASCLITQENNLPDVHSHGTYAAFWDHLYNNSNDFHAITAIPPNLGLDFVFDGTGSAITAQIDGVWAFTYCYLLSPDATVQGALDLSPVGVLNNPFGPGIPTSTVANNLGSAEVLFIPSGASFSLDLLIAAASTANPYPALGPEMEIVRLV